MAVAAQRKRAAEAAARAARAAGDAPPYPISLVPGDGDPAGRWRAVVEDLPGCEARGATPEEAAARARAAIDQWVRSATANGQPVPPPREEPTHSGKLLVRMPPSLHSELARLADREKVSLNTLIIGALGGAVGWGAGGSDKALTPGADGEPAPDDRARLLSFAVTLNVVLVAVAASVAICLLLVALLT